MMAVAEERMHPSLRRAIDFLNGIGLRVHIGMVQAGSSMASASSLASGWLHPPLASATFFMKLAILR